MKSPKYLKIFDKKFNLVDFCYPVGSLYWTSNADFDPNVEFGGGEAVWERIKDRFVLAAGDTYTTVGVGNVTSGDGIGGEAIHTLTTSEMPSHTHGISHTHNINHRHDSCSFSGTTGTPIGASSTSASTTTSSADGAFGVDEPDKTPGTSGFVRYTNSDTWHRGGSLGTYSYDADAYLSFNHTHTFNHRHTVTTSGNTSYANVSSGAASTSTSGSNGSSNAHNNMPPYIVKYCWERIA